MPNTDMLKESPFAQKFGFRNSIEVNDHLQVDGRKRPHAILCQNASPCTQVSAEAFHLTTFRRTFCRTFRRTRRIRGAADS